MNPLAVAFARYEKGLLLNGANLRQLAWVGDGLLAGAVRVVLCEQKMSLADSGRIFCEIVSNRFLHAAGVGTGATWFDGNSGPASGTMIEAVIAKLYADDGMEPVIEIARYLVSLAPKIRESRQAGFQLEK